MINLNQVSYAEDAEGKKVVILSVENYENLQRKLEELEDVVAYHFDKKKFPFALFAKLESSNESRIKIFREYRGCSVKELAELTGVSEAYLLKIENQKHNKRNKKLDVYLLISDCLNVDIELLV
jgi:DNA-binding XRE family transcriptional regulator